jgi:dTDP-4-amino-4,6-dideoxygalactose transaminase
MTDAPIPFGRPMTDEIEMNAIAEVMASGIMVHGKVTPAFEEAFAERAGTKHAVALSSCTAGLHLTLFVRNIGPGDYVAVPAMTHVATAHAVELMGATPVFIDVEADSGNMDATILKSIEQKLSVIMPVHYLGLPCDMDAINTIANDHNAFVLEDCALAVDATYGLRKAGGLGLAGSFSFYPVKHMTSIEGGMVTTDDDELATALRKRRAFGYNRALGERTRPGIYDVDELGFNYRMNEVEAAVGLAQLQKLDRFQAARAQNHKILKAHLDEIEDITVFNNQKGKAKSSHYCLNAILPRDGSLSRAALVDDLKAQGIGTSVHYPGAVPLFSYYQKKYNTKTGSYPVAEWLAEQTISLPIGPHLGHNGADRIGEAFAAAVKRNRSS